MTSSDVDVVFKGLDLSAGNRTERQKLRLLTYMPPDISLDTFYLIRDLIEQATGMETDLLVEERFPGPLETRTDPFTANSADIMALHTSEYLRLNASGYDKMELCGAAPLHRHPLSRDRPVCFSEIIIHVSNRHRYKTMNDLKGCTWAYGRDSDGCSTKAVLNYLAHSLGTNSTYFGNIIQSGSNKKAIEMVLNFTVQAAAVDSVSLAGFLREHAECPQKVVSIVSIGPIPIYPLVFNASLSHDLKESITQALLSMHNVHSLASRLNDIGISKYVAIDSSLYFMEPDITSTDGFSSTTPAYY